MKRRLLAKSIFYLGVLVAWLYLVPSPLMADTISDSYTICNPQGECQSYELGEITEAQNGNVVWYITDATLADPSQFGYGTALWEAGGSASGPYSDIFGVLHYNGNYYLAFGSDSNENGFDLAAFSTLLPVSIFMPEGDGIFDATMYLAPSLRSQGYAQFQSSVVPEPNSLLLMASSLSGLGLFRFTRRRR